MLRACDYSNEDICSVLAHASSYFVDTYEKCGEAMDLNEIGNVLALLTFLAHSYVLDETCRLKIWHKYLFTKYCSLGMLSSAVMRLMEIRNYRLRLDDEDLKQRYTALVRTSAKYHRHPRISLDGSSSAGTPKSQTVSPSTSSGSGGWISSCSSEATPRRISSGSSEGDLATSTVRALDFA
jgi:hypothetical protein